MVYTMSMTKTEQKQHDEQLARLYFDHARALKHREVVAHRIIHEAGVKEHRFGKETARGWGSEDIYHDFPTAFDIVEAKNVNLVADYEHAEIAIAELENEIGNMEALYTGWSRFFVVTSSQGHIHSSMTCSSCYRTTTYGWLPELSGDSEAEAVATHGPALCTVCFPSAPVEDTGLKITQSRAQELAWSPDRQEKIAAREERERIKAEKKAKKEANALKHAETMAHKMNALIDQFGENTNAAYEWTWTNKGYDNAYFAYSDMIERNRRRTVTR